jgi:hypothetical protein
MCLPPIHDTPSEPPPSTSPTPVVHIPITSPNHMTSPSHSFSIPLVTQTYTRRPCTFPTAGPEEPVDDHTNIKCTRDTISVTVLLWHL